MRNFTIYLVTLLCFFASKMLGQETFEKRAKTIALKIETITKEEKAALKIEVEAINNQLINGAITREEAESKKKLLAEARAINIESRVAVEQEALKNLVQEKVDGKIKEQDSSRTYSFSFHGKKHEHGFKDTVQGERRTTSQFVFATGLNNLVTDSKLEDSDYRFLGSHFYELGVTYNSRIAKNNNLLHAKYGLSLMYNNLRPTDNRNFVINGDQTNLVVNPIDIKDSRFRNVYLVAPVHIEFDFSEKKMKEDKPFYKTHQSVRFGIGGYAGINLKSKQIIKYDDNDLKATEKTKGDFNTSNFIYGLSTYIGYKETSLYLKYDLNPLFKDNVIKQNNVSLGLRFDLN
ncbi:hypothetical protein [Flavobacterium algoritolerans]|uniref:Outer membrane protein beta-barrel domain-containing protein n=1 Tax=Flavobacterium algoritolerans TaxID=3041254 RepID=A0ABT6V8Q7_9FLAO|nr:hypothetical protein [Flavobacterium algoritolerans]MDI5893584.1 hypothetical protein [Flavobacterium algoritolerans]